MKTLLTHFVLAVAGIACGQEIPDNPNVDPRIEFFPLRVTARIVDESGQPIEGATVDAGIGNLRYKDQLNNFVGKSDSAGKFSAESLAVAAYVQSVVSKDGYYLSRRLFEGMENDHDKVRKVGRFEPWDSALQFVAPPAELFSNVVSVRGHLYQQPGLADVAQVGREEPGRERAPHQVEKEGGLHVAPWGRLA